MLEVLWEALMDPGGSFALIFIFALVLGICVMTLVFLVSAVIALEHFARAVRGWWSVIGCGLPWSLLIATGAFALVAQEGSVVPSDAAFADIGTVGGAAFLAVTLLMGLIWLSLRWLGSDWVALGILLLIGAGLALLLGSTGRPLFPSVPCSVSGLLAGVLWLRRGRGKGGSTGVVERFLQVLAGLFAAAVVLAWVLEAPAPAPAAVGSGLLGFSALVLLLGLLPLAAAGLVDTRGTVEWFIAVRYLLAKRRQTFISVITGICVVGIAAGVWLIITVLSVMNGFERTWREEIIGNRAHFTVHSGLGPFDDYAEILAKVEGVPEVVAASPYLDAEGMVRGSGGEIMGVRLRGVDPQRVGSVTDLREDLVAGSLDDLMPAGPGEDPGILIGSRLGAPLGVGVGDELLLISPFGGPQTPLGPAPRLKRFRVVGIFESSFFQYDEVFTYVHLNAAQDFRQEGDVADGIEARTTDFYRSRRVADMVAAELQFPFFTRDWKEFFPAFFQALKSERIMMFILLTMIMVVAAFSIVSTLVMMIMEKESDIAILKTMGAHDDRIERIFAIEGTLIGLVGTGLGVIAAFCVTARIASIQEWIETLSGIDTLPASVYQFSTLPAELDAGQIVTVVALALILSLGATLLPSRQGARLDPVESLRYE